MLTNPGRLTDAHRTVFYRLVELDTALQQQPPGGQPSAAARSASPGSSPNSAL